MSFFSGHDEKIQNVLTEVLLWLSAHGFEFSNREWAALIWLVILAAIALSKPKIRSGFVKVLRAAATPKVAALWIIYAAWIMVFVVVTDRIGIWRAVLTKDTLLWGVTGGVVLLMGSTEASEPGYFRRAVFKVINITVIFEYLVNLEPFSFWTELVLQPILSIIIVAPIIVDEPEQQKTWRRLRNWFSVVFAVILISYTAQAIHESWSILNWDLFVLQAVWPMLLGIWVLILVFVFAVFMSYEQAFLQLEQVSNGCSGLWKAKLGLVLALGIRLKWIHEAAKGGTNHVANEDTISDAYRAAKHFRNETIESMREEAVYQRNLNRYAGSTELDEEGHPRDKREFRESIRALEWLHTCQMGWYRREPTGYEPDLIERFGDDFTRFGLNKPSGITLEVSDDRERWYAWRQTPGGHCFAIGASDDPPNKWQYDGPNPPKDFPGIGSEWGKSPFSMDQAPNWHLQG